MKLFRRDLLLSGNFYNMQPACYPIENKVDLGVTEMDHTLFRQPYYNRFCADFAPGKPVIIAENPYGGNISTLLRYLNNGRGYDLYLVFLLEAAMYGCNMSVPYGGWMGNTIRDSFWSPHDLTCGVQRYDDGKEVYVHILNYRCDAEADRVSNVDQLRLRVRGMAGVLPEIIVPGGGQTPASSALPDSDDALVTLPGVG